MSTRLYLNGRWLAPEEATVSVMDRGFLFGDGVYEVIPVYSRRPFRLTQHLQRLQRSLQAIGLRDPHTADEWHVLIAQLVAEAATADQSIYIQVTRGPTPVRSHAFPTDPRPTVLMFSEPMQPPGAEPVRDGVTAISAPDIRWLRCDIKATSLLANCMLRQLAPVKDQRILPGVTYDVVLELAAAHDVPVNVRDIREEEVRGADELWLASSPREVLPIVVLDGEKVGAGKTAPGRPGPLFVAMHGWYQAFKAQAMRGGNDGGASDD